MQNNKYKDDSIRLKNYDYTKVGAYFITVCTKNKECLFGYIDDGKMVLNDAGIMLGKWYLEMENKYPSIRCCEYVAMPNHIHCIITIIGKQNIPIVTPDAHDRNRGIYTEIMDAHDRNREIYTEIMDAHDRKREIYTEIMDAHVGAPLRGRPSPEKRVVLGLRGRPSPEKRVISGARGRPSPEKRVISGARGHPSPENDGCLYGPNNIKYNATIPQMVDWFKTMTTNEYIRGVKKYNWPRYDHKLWQKNYYDHIIRSEHDLIRIRKYIINNPGKWKEKSNTV